MLDYLYLFTLKELSVSEQPKGLVHVLYVTMGIWPTIFTGVRARSVNDS